MTLDAAAKDMLAAKLPVKRLCNEIQLFDLCDLETCSFKDGRFCTHAEYLAEFEQISEAETIRPEVFGSGDPDEDEDGFEEEYDDAFDDEGYGEEAEYDD